MSRRFQFSLRMIFVSTALVAIGCLVGPPLFEAIRERFAPPQNPAPRFLTDAELAQILGDQSRIALSEEYQQWRAKVAKRQADLTDE